jgi:hypothetical protein
MGFFVARRQAPVAEIAAKKNGPKALFLFKSMVLGGIFK